MLDEQRVAVGGRRALNQAVLAPGLVNRCVRTLGRHKTLLPCLLLVVPVVVSLRPSKPERPRPQFPLSQLSRRSCIERQKHRTLFPVRGAPMPLLLCSAFSGNNCPVGKLVVGTLQRSDRPVNRFSEG